MPLRRAKLAWLGWIVIVIGGVMAFFLSMAIILGVIGAIFDRLTANIKEELHTRLKIEAAKRRVYIGDLLEELIQDNIPKL